MIDCAGAQEAIGDLLSGEIDASARAEVERHLQACRRCAAETERVRTALERLAVAEVPDPGPAYWEAFGPRLRRRIAARRPRAPRFLLPLAAAAAAAGILLLARLPDGDVGPGRGAASPPAAVGEEPAAPGAEAEAASEALLERAAEQSGGLDQVLAILDETVPADPFATDDGPLR